MHVAHVFHGPWSGSHGSITGPLDLLHAVGRGILGLLKQIVIGVAALGLLVFFAFPLALLALAALPAWLFVSPGFGVAPLGEPIEPDEDDPEGDYDEAP